MTDDNKKRNDDNEKSREKKQLNEDFEKKAQEIKITERIKITQTRNSSGAKDDEKKQQE
jgi:hypothetical protein